LMTSLFPAGRNCKIGGPALPFTPPTFSNPRVL
jgi:hypothetical protein